MKAIHERRFRPALLAAVLLVAMLAAAARAEKGDARAILEEASKALGEDKPWTTRVEAGLHIAWNTPGWGTLKAAYTRSVQKPDKIKIDQDNSAYDHPFYRTYYMNGDDAWYMVNLNIGRNPNVTSNLKNFMERVDGIAFFITASDTFFTAAEIQPDSLLSGEGLVRAGCVLKGDTLLWDLDEKTHLPARRIEGASKRTYVLEDYRDTAGRKVPFHVTVYNDGRKAEEFVWDSVTFDVDIDGATFEENRPPSQ